ncbi:MAG: hypothetical protein U1F30_14150 [Steroidobacteraceae bacterium]
MRSLNCDGRHGLALAATLLLLAVLAAGGEPWRLALQYQRGAIGAGEWWRLLGAHVVHLGLRHVLLDATGLALLWVLYARALAPRRAVALAAALIAIDAGPVVAVARGGLVRRDLGAPCRAWAAGALGNWPADRRHAARLAGAARGEARGGAVAGGGVAAADCRS